MATRYDQFLGRIRAGQTVVLDGGTGTELERRGVVMDPDAWCGPASLDNVDVLEGIHRDYIRAGAQVVTANTYASSRIMLEAAGVGDQFEVINRTAVETALRAAEREGRDRVLVAGSLSHMAPIMAGCGGVDEDRMPSTQRMADAFAELAQLLADAGCDVIILEMMYDPARTALAFEAAAASGIPFWAGFSARRGADGSVLTHESRRDVPFAELVSVLDGFEVDIAGVMHTSSDLTADALEIVKARYAGPLMAYPDSGHFEMPSWQFHDIIEPERLARYARGWIGQGARVVGGCCGISPEHIAALRFD